MQVDGTATNANDKKTRDAVLVFIAAHGEGDYLNLSEMHKRDIEVAKAAADAWCKRRSKVLDPATVNASVPIVARPLRPRQSTLRSPRLLSNANVQPNLASL